MGEIGVVKSYNLGDRSTSDIIVYLKNREGRPEWFYCHSLILTKKSKFFADKLSRPESTNCIEYLEAVPWEDKEEEEILRVVAGLSQLAMPILARIQPVDLTATKNVFLSAMRFATSSGVSCPLFVDKLKTSAQEQVEFMLVEDEDTPLVTADEEVKCEVRVGLLNAFSLFVKELDSLLLEFSKAAENRVLQCLLDLEWLCNIVPKMDMMKDFVLSWVEISNNVLGTVQDKKLDSIMWGLKLKLIEISGKLLEAVGYGNVILPAPVRALLLKTWLPYVRKMKPLLDSEGDEETDYFPYKMDDELCQSIEGAIMSLVLALPSNDQADIFADWMQTAQVKFPDLSEAFEVWCYRTKSAKRRLLVGFDGVENATVTL
ncbi:hypothetical protein GIB67_001621 [Kingdonia uniflora]|uniref:At3g05675-like ankyrin-like domain-containing protein n=1 Tax=Kingdonia uniflora TaxID=39325 RepID=A0A7J7L0X1_9MAGN|nr:hypothetical protein GIB67_001621 [Kingdonia uniflora]